MVPRRCRRRTDLGEDGQRQEIVYGQPGLRKLDWATPESNT
jgi:hypothetical protein